MPSGPSVHGHSPHLAEDSSFTLQGVKAFDRVVFGNSIPGHPTRAPLAPCKHNLVVVVLVTRAEITNDSYCMDSKITRDVRHSNAYESLQVQTRRAGGKARYARTPKPSRSRHGRSLAESDIADSDSDVFAMSKCLPRCTSFLIVASGCSGSARRSRPRGSQDSEDALDSEVAPPGFHSRSGSPEGQSGPGCAPLPCIAARCRGRRVRDGRRSRGPARLRPGGQGPWSRGH